MRSLMVRFRPAFALCSILLIYAGLIDFSRADQEGYEHLTAPEVKSMIGDGRTILVHVLTSVEFEMQHIPGSINIPIVDIETTEKLPKDIDTPLIFYCMGKR